MKKVKYLITLFSLLFICNSYSQNYIPMLTNDAQWTVYVSGGPYGSYSTYTYLGDITIAGQVYKNYSGWYVREDALAKKVYRYWPSIGEQLSLDFSLSDGDVGPNGTIHITTINVNGGTRRKFQYYNSSGVPLNNPSPFIEGVGGIGNPFLSSYFGQVGYSMVCSYQNGNMIYNRGLVNSGTLEDCHLTLGINTQIFSENNIVLSPNPFKTELHISSSVLLEKAHIIIYNYLGQVVKEIKNIDGNKIVLNRENLSSGIYIIKLFQNDILISTKKAIAE